MNGSNMNYHVGLRSNVRIEPQKKNKVHNAIIINDKESLMYHRCRKREHQQGGRCWYWELGMLRG